MRQLRGRKTNREDMYPREPAMSDVIHSPEPSSRSLEEDAAEFLALLEQMIASSSKPQDDE